MKGSDIGTPTDPKFALRTLWAEIILPAYDALTAVGGPAEGAVIVHQEDNAPPHQEGDFHALLVEEFQKPGWRLELQAPQGPYTNVLDIQVKIIMPLHLRLPVTCILSIRQCQTRRFSLQCSSITSIYYRCLTTRSRATTGFGRLPRMCRRGSQMPWYAELLF